MNNENEDLIPVEGYSSLFRDRFTGAIVNTDKSAYANYIRMKEQKQREEKKHYKNK